MLCDSLSATPYHTAGVLINALSSFSTAWKSDMELDGSSCTEHSEHSLGTEFSQYKTGTADVDLSP